MRKVYLLGILVFQFFHTELFAQCNLVLDPSGNQVLCNGEFSKVINYVGDPDSGFVFTWTNDNPSIGLPAFGTGVVPGFLGVNLSDAPKVAHVTVRKSRIIVVDRVFDTSSLFFETDIIPAKTIFARIIVGGARGGKILEAVNDSILVKGGQAAGAAASFLVGPNEILNVGDTLMGHVGRKGQDLWLSGYTDSLGSRGGGGSIVSKGAGPLNTVLVAAGGGGGGYIERYVNANDSVVTFRLAGGDGGVILDNGLPVGVIGDLSPDPGGSHGGYGGGFRHGQNSSAANFRAATGGTSYLHPARKDSINVPGVWDGDGRVVIEYSTLGPACDSETITFTVNPSPAKPTFSSLNLQSGSMTLGICQGSDNVNFNVDAIDENLSYHWSANPPNVQIKDPNSPHTAISFPNSGSFTITLEASNGYSCTSSSSQTFTITPNGNFQERSILLKQPGNILIYPDNSMNPINGYQWGYDSLFIVDGDTMSGAPVVIDGQVYQFFTPDSKFLKNDHLNLEALAFWVSLRKGDCITRVYYNGPRRARYILNAPEDNSVVLKTIPNPNNGSFSLSLQGNIYGDVQAHVYNVLGQMVATASFSKTTSTVVHPFKTDLPDGLYYINLQSSDLKKAQTRFIIQHP
jgi:hypothetical protein